MRPLTAEINLAALRYNFSQAQLAAPTSKNFAVIKADAYGHGAVQCANALAASADGFAVASVEEAVELRLAKIKRPIIVLSAFSQPDEVELLAQYQLLPVIHSSYQLQLLAQQNNIQTPINCWLKVETGMNRLGLDERELLSALETSSKLNCVNAVGIMSHLASSDETSNNFTQIQTERFLKLTNRLGLPLSLANSCAIMAWPDSHRDWNRPGIMLYGTSSLDSELAMKLKPVMHFHSQIISIKSIKKGQSVGYGQTFIADRDMKIGVVACGYADGYPRGMSCGAPIVVKGNRSKILGRVSMDSLCADVTAIDDVEVGDRVELWGQGLSVREIADAAATIPYELLTRVSKRVPRVYQS